MAINLFKMQDMLKNMSKDQLVAEAQNPTGTAPAFMVHARLAEVGEQEKEASRNASAADTTTVAQDVVQGAGIGGIGAMSQAFNPRAQNSADNGAFDPRTVQDTTGRPAEPVRMADGGEVGGETRGRPAEPIRMAPGGEVGGRGTVLDGIVYELMPDGTVRNAMTGQMADGAVADRVRAKLLDPRLSSGPDQTAAPTWTTLEPQIPAIRPVVDTRQTTRDAIMQAPTLAPPADTQDQYANRTIGGPSDFQQAPLSPHASGAFGVGGLPSLPDMSRPVGDMSYPTTSAMYPPQLADSAPPPMPSVDRNGGNPSFVETTAENEVFAPLDPVGPANELLLNARLGRNDPLRGPAGSAASDVDAPYRFGSDTLHNAGVILRTTVDGGFQWLDGYAGHDTYGPAGMPIEADAPVGPLGPAGPAVDTPAVPDTPTGPSAPAGPSGGIAGVAAPATAEGALSTYDQMLADALAENESDRAQAKWLLLAEIGAGMLGSTEPGFAGTGQAISAGLGSYTDAKDALKAEAMGIAGLAEDQRRYEQNRADQFAMAARGGSSSGAARRPLASGTVNDLMEQYYAADSALASMNPAPGRSRSYLFGTIGGDMQADPLERQRNQLTRQRDASAAQLANEGIYVGTPGTPGTPTTGNSAFSVAAP